MGSGILSLLGWDFFLWSCFRFLLLGDISLLFRLVLLTFLSAFLSSIVMGSARRLIFFLISVLSAFGWRSWGEVVSAVVVGFLSRSASASVDWGLRVTIGCLGASLISLIFHICNGCHHLLLIHLHLKLLLVHQQLISSLVVLVEVLSLAGRELYWSWTKILVWVKATEGSHLSEASNLNHWSRLSIERTEGKWAQRTLGSTVVIIL